MERTGDMFNIYTGKVQLMSYTDLVNIRQGSASCRRFSNGNTLPLTQLPFAMAALCPQTTSDSGTWFYHPEHRSLEGIRLTHQPSPWIGDYGCFCLQPQMGEPGTAPDERWSGFRPEEAVLRPEYIRLRFLRAYTNLEAVPTLRGARLRLSFSGQEQPWLSVLPVHGKMSFHLDV